MSSFAERLADLRNERKLTQTEFARKFGVGRSTVAMWETGERTPDLETMKKLADFFDVSLDYLAGESDARHSDKQKRNMAFSYRLKSLRNARMLRQSELAKRLGIPLSELIEYESGIIPNDQVINKIANFFEVNREYLLGETDNSSFDLNKEVILDDLPDEYRNNLGAYIKAFVQGLNEIEEVMEADPEDEKKVKEHMFNILTALTVDKKQIPVPVLRLFLKQLEVLQEEINKNAGRERPAE